MKHRTAVLTVLALLLALCLTMTGCNGFLFQLGYYFKPDPTAETEQTNTPVSFGYPPIDPIDPEDEALIRWQNAGHKDYLPDGRIQMVSFPEMVYTRPDTERLYADFDELAKRAETESDAESLLNDFYDLYTRYISFYSMDTLANIRYSQNQGDSYYKAEYDFCEAETPALEEKYEALNKAFAASPSREALEKAYFGNGYFERFDDYEVYTNPEYLRLSQEEAALLSEYRDLTGDVQVTYNHVTKSLDEWLESDDYYEYIGALKAYYEQYNTKLGGIYIKLVKIRKQLAQTMEYDSYAEYSYDMSYSRDYSPSQGDSFLQGIRQHLVPVMELANHNAALNRLSVGSATEGSVLEMLSSAARRLGGVIGDAFRFMQAYELYDISKSAVKVESSFQTYIYDYEAPFVLVNAQRSGNDYTTFAHEFGHFVDAYYNYGANEDLETAETYSQAMEFLALKYNDTLSERKKETLIRCKLLDALQTFVYQGAYADFEARVYALEEKELSVQKINEIYRQVCKDYGFYDSAFDFYYSQAWIDIIHFFEVPYYIISYCVSAETSLQVYQLEAEEDGAGVEAYLRLLDRNLSAGVQRTMEDAGMRNPFRDEVLEQTADFFLEELGLNEN